MPTPPPSLPTSSFEVRGPAVIAWEPEAGCCRYLEPDPAKRHVLLEAHLDESSSLFRLRIPVRLKHLDETYLYFHLPPDHISSFEWTADHVAPDAVRQRLNGSITLLRFCLHTPGQLIVPALDTHPKRPATARVIEALKLLASASFLSVYIEPTVLSKARLQLLDAAIRSGNSQTPTRYLDLRSLYNGRGGKRYVVLDEKDVSTASEDAASTVAVDSPPPYEEIGPGPPMPPVATAEKLKRRRSQRSNSRNSAGSQSRPSKRGTGDASPGPETRGLELANKPAERPLTDLESLVRKQQEQIQAQQRELTRLSTALTSLECLVATLQERLDRTEDRAEGADTRNYELEEEVEALREEIPDTEEIAEDAVNRIRVEVYEQIEESIGDVLARMRNALGTYFAPALR